MIYDTSYDISCHCDVSDQLIYEPKYDCSNILLIDNRVEDYQDIVNSVNSNTLAIVYSYSSTKEDLSNVLSNLNTIERIGFAFSFNPNSNTFLDNEPFFSTDSSSNIDPQSENLLFLIELFTRYNVKNVDYLACDTLKYESWNNYYNSLISNTTTIIGASDNKTGNIKYGGDWILESTGQDIESIYFTKNIEYYRYLLDISTWFSTNTNQNSVSLITMYDSVTSTYLMFSSSGNNGWCWGCNFNPPTSGTNNCNNSSGFGNTGYVYGTTVFTSAYTNTATNKKIIIAALSSNYIGYYYNCVLSQNTYTINDGYGTISSNTTWFNTGATLSTTTKLALYNNNRLFYSLNNGNIGSTTITDGTTPSISTANNTYITTTLLSSSTTLYPIGLTIDTNGYLYTILGNVTTAPTTGVIKVINITSTPSLVYTISLTSSNITSWGNPYNLIWYSNTLYIGTVIGNASVNTSKTGNILYCNTTSGSETTVTSTLTPYKTSTNSIGGMSITGTKLYVSSLNSPGASSIIISQYDLPIIVNIGTNSLGFYYNNVDICNNFTSINLVTNPQYSGANFSTRFYTYYNNQYYDLAQLYYINPTLNSTPFPITSFYTSYNSTNYDLSSFFQKR